MAANGPRVDDAHHDAIFHIVDGVGDIVCKIHYLAFHGPPVEETLFFGYAACHPVEGGQVIGVNAEFLSALPFCMPRGIRFRPRVFDRCIKAGAGQVEPGRMLPLFGEEDFWFEAGEETKCLRVAFEPSNVCRNVGQFPFARVPKRRVAEVVCKTGTVHHIGIAAEQFANLTADLRDLERVGEARAGEIVRPCRLHLGLLTQAAQRGGVDDPRTVAFECRSRARFPAFGCPSFLIVGTIAFVP